VKREETSATQAMMTPIASAAIRTAKMLARPRSAAMAEGNPKTPLPIMQLTMSAARLQRPMARTRPSDDVPDADASVSCVSAIAILYHKPTPEWAEWLLLVTSERAKAHAERLEWL